jgi:predicted O-methyltransferase YrrM
MDSRTAVDLVVSSVLDRPDLPPLQNAERFVEFLRNSLKADKFRLSTIRDERTRQDATGRHFSTLIQYLTTDLPPLPLDTAVRMGLIADALTARKDPLDLRVFFGDVGSGVDRSSSSVKKGRLLAALVRFGRVKTAFEIGTSYGMSGMFIATALPADGRLGTCDPRPTAVEVSGPLFKTEEPERVITYTEGSIEVVEQVRRDLGPIGLLYHDGRHSGEAYVEDFAAYEPLMGPTSIVLFDDIRWEKKKRGPSWKPAHTYEGWREVANHPRVRAAFDINDAYGLLLLK